MAGAAGRTFLRSVGLVVCIGAVAGAIGAYVLREHGAIVQAAAVGIAVGESMAAGIWLGGKKTMVAALARGVETLGLGRAAVRTIFERVFAVSPDGAAPATQIASRVPLSEAATLLKRAVNGILTSTEGHGPANLVQRKLKSWLLAAIERYTLGRFRVENQTHGGIDLAQLKSELETNIDPYLANRLRSKSNQLSILLLIGWPMFIVAQAWLVLILLQQLNPG
jgi:hypothetical protein